MIRRLLGLPSKKYSRAIKQLEQSKRTRNREFYTLDRFNEEELHKLLRRIGEARVRVLELASGYLSESACALLASVVGKKQSPIVELQLQCNDITDNGVKYIAKAITKAPSLEKLDLSWNKITDEGVECLAEAIKRSSLKSLDLSYNAFTDKGAAILKEALLESRIQNLRLGANTISPSIVHSVDATLRVLNSELFKLAVVLCTPRTLKGRNKKSGLHNVPLEIIREILFAVYGKHAGMTSSCVAKPR